MNLLHAVLIAGTAILVIGCAKPPASAIVEAQGQNWATALASRQPATITNLYDKDAVLLATFSDKVDGSAEIQEYFVGLTKNEGLRVTFNEQEIRTIAPNVVSNSGLYTFAFEKDGKTVEVPARYTFVYRKTGDGWKIMEHHSSIRPESGKK